MIHCSLDKHLSNRSPFWVSNLAFSGGFSVNHRCSHTSPTCKILFSGRPHRPLPRTHAPANMATQCHCGFTRRFVRPTEVHLKGLASTPYWQKEKHHFPTLCSEPAWNLRNLQLAVESLKNANRRTSKKL